jgi:lauroyl/myristoyl acyltransferase
MDTLFYLAARPLISLLQLLPMGVTASIGRSGGKLAFCLDLRHRNMALNNLAAAFPEKSPREIRTLALENFARIGESFACAAKTASLPANRIRDVLEVEGLEKIASGPHGEPRSRIFAIGHFGNFELYARSNVFLPGYTFATTYRGLRHPALDGLLNSLRAQSGCLFFERRRDASALKQAMGSPGIVLGFLADQSAGKQGVQVPFFGRDCSTTPAPAIFALRYHCPLHAAICFRTSLGRWRIEIGDEIPLHLHGRARSVKEITADINSAFEAAIRRDPANWFWVHNRWKLERRNHSPQPARS